MATDMDKLKQLSSLKYAEQAKWFLNAYFEKYGEDEYEKVWNYAHKMAELDEKNGADGNELDELYAHRFLEIYGETMTVREMREILRKIDIDTNNKVSLSEYLISTYGCDWHELVNAAQSDNKEEIDEAMRLVAEAAEAVNAAQDARKAAREAEAAARSAEAEQRKAEAATKAALAELEAEEKAFADKKADLQRRSEEGGLVSRNKAKNELQQLLAEDPLPLQRAKINQGATVRAQEKSTRAAEAAAQRATEASNAAEQAVTDAQASMQKAEEYLHEVKSKPGSGKGAVWWMERELHEQRKFMPMAKGGIAK